MAKQKMVYSANRDRAISVFSEGMNYGVVAWDGKTNREMKRQSLNAPVNLLVMSPNGKNALIVTHQETIKDGMLGRERDEYNTKDSVIVWHIDPDKTKRRSFPHQVTNAVWLDDTHILITCANRFMVWDASLENLSNLIPMVYQGDGWQCDLLYDAEKVIFLEFSKTNMRETLSINLSLHDKKSGLGGLSRRLKSLLKQIEQSPNPHSFVMAFNDQSTITLTPVDDSDTPQKVENGKKVSAFAWSPDATKIIFAEFDNASNKRMWIWEYFIKPKNTIHTISL